MSLFDNDLVGKTTPKEDFIKTALDKVKDVVMHDMTHYRGATSLIKLDLITSLIKSDLINELHDKDIYRLRKMDVSYAVVQGRIPSYHIMFRLVDLINQYDMGFDIQVSIKGIDHYSVYDF